MINIIEHDCKPKCLVYGEPQLGARGLYPLISKKGSSDAVKTRLNVISYCDGEHSLLEISELCKVSFEELLDEVKLLERSELQKYWVFIYNYTQIKNFLSN